MLILLFLMVWQNYDLVKDNKEDIKKLIEHQDISRSNVENNKEKAFVHVRRTDYLGFGENLDTEYYRKALNYIKENKRKLSISCVYR